jgi:hypothetical protein
MPKSIPVIKYLYFCSIDCQRMERSDYQKNMAKDVHVVINGGNV